MPMRAVTGPVLPCPPLAVHVVHVVLRRTEKQMGRIDAVPHIAVMADEVAGRDCPPDQFVHDAMGA